MEIRHATSPAEFADLDTEALRERFLADDLFTDGQLRLVATDHERLVIGGVQPAGSTVALGAPPDLGAASFCERRELAVVCVAGTGVVSADGQDYPMSAHDVLYVGRGTRDVTFTGADARFYLVSAPAHTPHPTTLAGHADVDSVSLGDPEQANVRTIRKYIHADGARSCQLVVGITTLAPGSVWNTMPCHTHHRRTEIYLYTGLSASDRVVHLCGTPEETRSMIVADSQAVISPPWSIHTGAGTSNYSFVWAMAGENQDFADMAHVEMDRLR